MSVKLKKLFSHGGTISFLIGFFLYIFTVLPILINDNGIMTFMGDYSSQSIPFTYHIRDCLLSGNVCWDWSSGLGSQFLGDYAYYNLFSPFSLFYLIVPRGSVIYAMPFVTALKYGVGSCLAFFYASRFLKNKHYAVIAGVIYMFSSFSGYNVIFHFADVFAFFPLLLIAVEELCVNKRRCVFALTVCFMALLNYYFFAGQAVFCVIYFFVRFFDIKLVNMLKKLLSVAFEAVMGFAMSAVFLLPVLVYLSASSKATGMIAPSDMLIYSDGFNYLKLIQSAFMLPDQFFFTSLFPSVDNVYPFGNLSASIAFYIPLFSMAGVISFAWARKKSWLTIIMVICGVMAFVPVLNQLFSALNSAYYVRWLYMPMLIACVMSLSALEEKISFKPGIITCTAVVFAMIIYQLVVDTNGFISKVSQRTNFSVYQTMLHFAVTVLSLVLLIVIVKSKRDKDFIPKLYIFSIICTYMCYGVMVQYLYSSIPSKDANTAAFAFGEDLPEECREGNPRIALSATNANLVWGADSPSHLNSLHDEGFTQFLDDSSLGYESGVYDRIAFDYKELCDLISVKYFAGLGKTGDKYDTFKKVGTMGEYVIYENPDYIPMGFVYDSMISRDAFLSIQDKKLKHLTYLKALVVADTSGFSDILTDISDTAGEEISDDEYERLISDRRRSAAYSCEKTNNGLIAQIELEKENVVFFSVSYNDGWSAYVDGEKTDVYNVNNGCVGVRAQEGRHEIRLCYTVKGFTEGIVITSVSSVVLLVYAVVCSIRNKNGRAPK